MKLGKKHPDPVVETASLSSVEPTDAWYKLSLPEECIRQGSLSALQLEAVVYASQQHDHILPDGNLIYCQFFSVVFIYFIKPDLGRGWR